MTPAADSALLDTLTVLACLLAGGAALFFVLGVQRYRLRSSLDERLRTYVAAAPGAIAVGGRGDTSLRRARVAIVTSVAVGVGRITSPRTAGRLRASLVSAGYPGRIAMANFLAAKAMLAGLLGLLGFLFALTLFGEAVPAALLAVTGAGAGYVLPALWLRQRISRRRQEISRSLPDALDLLSICVTAGLGFDGALMEVTRRWRNPLTEELNTVQRDMRLGKTRREALRDFNDRAGVPEVGSLVAVVVQTEELGTPLREALRQQSDQMRRQRRQNAEERARQAVIKMLIPMVLFIFPAIFIVLIGPTVPMLVSLAGGGP